MPEILYETDTCKACGAKVRPGSHFCYNCGGSLAIGQPAASAATAINDVWLKGEIVEPVKRETTKLAKPKRASAAATAPADTPVPKPGIQEEARLKSAASLRKRAKSYQRKTVEVFWEEHSRAPNGRYFLASLILAVVVALILLAAMYLK